MLYCKHRGGFKKCTLWHSDVEVAQKIRDFYSPANSKNCSWNGQRSNVILLFLRTHCIALVAWRTHIFICSKKKKKRSKPIDLKITHRCTNTLCTDTVCPCTYAFTSHTVQHRHRSVLMDERHPLLTVVVSLRLLFFFSGFTGLCAVAGHLKERSNHKQHKQ